MDVGKLNTFDLMREEGVGTRTCAVVRQFCSWGWCICGVLEAEPLGLPEGAGLG